MSRNIKSLGQNSKLKKCGAKSFNLALLLNWGFKVPIGYYLIADAFELFLKFNRLQNNILEIKKKVSNNEIPSLLLSDMQQKILTAKIPKSILTEIDNVMHHFAGRKLAIRSSAILEDSPQKSYAGLFDSFLDVQTNLPEIINALKKVWSSLFNERVFKYHPEIYKEPVNSLMGVLIQEMICPQKTGIAFSVHPVSNDPDMIYIEEVSGLSDQLASGETSPKIHTFFKHDLDFDASSNWIQNLSHELIRLEKYVKVPIDVEWALLENDIYFLQFRPITTFLDKKITVLTNDNVGEVLPEVVTPLTWSILGSSTNESFLWTVKKLNVPFIKGSKLFKLVNQKAYFNQSFYRQVLNQLYFSGFSSSAYIKNWHWKFLRSIWYRMSITLSLCFMLLWLPVITRQFLKKVKNIYSNEKFYLNSDAKQIKLIMNICRLLDFEQEIMNLHIANTFLGDILYNIFSVIMNKFYLSGSANFLSKLTSNSGDVQSAISGKEMGYLAKSIDNYLFDKKIGPVSFNKFVHLYTTDKEISSKVNKYLSRYGYMSDQEFELSYPRWEEDPSSFLKILYNLIINCRRAEAAPPKENGIEEKKSSEYQVDQNVSKFLEVPARTVKYLNKNRENLKQTFIKIHYLLKKHYLQLGSLLSSENFLNEPKDILFLTLEEIKQLMVSTMHITSQEAKYMVKIRKGVYADCLKMEHPMRLIEVDGRVKNQVSGKIGDSDLINGIPCSSGYKIGVARVLKKFAEGNKLQKNEILVTHSANPGWVPLYLLASGIVTEIGGALSHSAIIAREYGIPMVASVSNACKNIKTGDHISIDGTHGIVKKL